MADLLGAFGLVLVIEGAAYAAFPGPLRRMVGRMLAAPEAQLRLGGILAAAAGLVIIRLARGG